MKFHQQEVRIVAVPTVPEEEVPVIFDPYAGIVPHPRRHRTEHALLGIAMGDMTVDDLQLFAQTCAGVVEDPPADYTALHDMQVTGGSILVEERSVLFGTFHLRWHPHRQIEPIPIPGQEERLGGI